ncbi:hypothetical protein AVEN_200720-1 [Araneus ventricosus]|uniref:Uncharacterized protein n=1 Tax=Araneus ventricosus TaxID=182803 RepID=A0A4Y2U4I9_ARAVE|nr:hypothetical protein AVEN_42397-1 [Araneus ventricosus]GBO07532.1 hypothetical protein AVEN_58802-1 [Araneus ventricosus]GBO11219.1 hypothetical protein AVEN_254417-1 [Araneus ventricosus]GBO11257.1 hypothetical protein AVEN_200720-1 [Araneus ventricosus]
MSSFKSLLRRQGGQLRFRPLFCIASVIPKYISSNLKTGRYSNSSIEKNHRNCEISRQNKLEFINELRIIPGAIPNLEELLQYGINRYIDPQLFLAKYLRNIAFVIFSLPHKTPEIKIVCAPLVYSVIRHTLDPDGNG